MLGIAALGQGGIYLSGRENPLSLGKALGIMLCVAGFSLFIGFLTPFCAAVVFLSSALSVLSSIQRENLEISTFCLAIISAALILLGPGAFSADARIFGKREIIIPERERKKDNEKNENDQKEDTD
ncbi:MAG TPA: hypothetical protein VF596_11720 [Pyrinomonadaceae bacterium]|jgi:uncharacterized membrane protein YphA (DoxX/SURF4 family)